jgi:hypothetical protein
VHGDDSNLGPSHFILYALLLLFHSVFGRAGV